MRNEVLLVVVILLLIMVWYTLKCTDDQTLPPAIWTDPLGHASHFYQHSCAHLKRPLSWQ